MLKMGTRFKAIEAKKEVGAIADEEWEPWEPTLGPQTQALYSPADFVGFGGRAGGGKSALLKILAATQHRRSIIFRREYPRLKDMIEKSRKFLRGSGAKYNSNDKIWRNIPGDRTLEFGSCQHEKDMENWRGQEHDLKGVDEATEFTKSQFYFLTGWCRSPEPNQRCRVVFTFNPPSNLDGQWVIDFLAPWLDPRYPDKNGKPAAQPGELRWFVGTSENPNVEVDIKDFFVTAEGIEHRFDSPDPVQLNDQTYWPRPKPIEMNGELLEPRSRTFIPATLEDNPYLKNSGYRGVLQSLPEPLRSQLLYGDFSFEPQTDPWQVLPSEWVRAAMKRWRDRRGIPQTVLGVDVARGGSAKTIIVARHDFWVAPLIKHPGSNTPDGNVVADFILEARHHSKVIVNIDVIGVGASPYDILRKQKIPINGLNGAMGTKATDRSEILGFKTRRSRWWWYLRELLDPSVNNPIELPDDDELFQDLTAPRWSRQGANIVVESKEETMKRLGRSPDCGDAVVYAFAPLREEDDNDYSWLKKL